MISPDAPLGASQIETFLLETLPSFGPPPRGQAGFARAQRFFARLGDPQDHALQVHIVGTAGKGTAAGAIVAGLVGAGATVGAHLSPHVYDVRERCLIGGRLPDWDVVGQAVREMWPAVLTTTEREGRPPSFFEFTTALAWVLGRAADVAVQVTEAGIGGEMDATNAIKRPDKLTVVVPIGFDHREILGDDLAHIAATKARAITEGGRVVVAPQPYREALGVIEDVAAQRGATVYHVTMPPAVGWTWHAEARAVADTVQGLLTDQLGLGAAGQPVSVDSPGRMERFETMGRTFVLDGAHNPLKLGALRQTMGTHRGPDLLIAALSHEKDLPACAAELAKLAPTAIATDFVVAAGDRVVRRSWSAQQLRAAMLAEDPALAVVAVPDVDAAVRHAVTITDPGATVVVTGSFMMLEPARAAVLRQEPQPATPPP